jgi:hypothetical protein
MNVFKLLQLAIKFEIPTLIGIFMD